MGDHDGDGGRIEASVGSRTIYYPLWDWPIERGGLSLRGTYTTGETRLSLDLQGDYFQRLESEGDYSFLLNTACGSLQSGIFTGQLGLCYDRSPFNINNQQILGLQLRLGEPWLYGGVYFGKVIFNTWEHGIPTQHFFVTDVSEDDYVSGVTVGGGADVFRFVANYDHRLDGFDGPVATASDESRLNVRVTSYPGTSRVLLFAGTQVFPYQEGYSLDSGIEADLVENLRLRLAYQRYDNFPTFIEFPGIEVPPYDDNRGEVGLSWRLLNGLLTLNPAFSIGQYDVTPRLRVATPYGGVQVAYSQEHDWFGEEPMARPDLLAMAYGNIPILEGDTNLALRPYTVVRHSEGNDLFPERTSFGAGAQVLLGTPIGVDVTARGGYMNFDGRDAGVVTFNIRYFLDSAQAGRYSEDTCEPLPLSGNRSAPIVVQENIVVIVPRPFGASRGESEFAHGAHVGENEPYLENFGATLQERGLGNTVRCQTCHASNGDVGGNTTVLHYVNPADGSTFNACNDCHGTPPDRPVGHLAGPVIQAEIQANNMTCERCHDPRIIYGLSGPTRGRGRIISNQFHPISTTREPNSSLFPDHGTEAQQDLGGGQPMAMICVTCHSGQTQYPDDSHLLTSCVSCHREGGHHTLEAQGAPNQSRFLHHGRDLSEDTMRQTCAPCHTQALDIPISPTETVSAQPDTCVSCHLLGQHHEGLQPSRGELGSRFPRHGVFANNSCARCHATTLSFPTDETNMVSHQATGCMTCHEEDPPHTIPFTDHYTLAQTSLESCQACHTGSVLYPIEDQWMRSSAPTCASCHRSATYHELRNPGWMEGGHQFEAQTNIMSCINCHSSENGSNGLGFCRDCHGDVRAQSSDALHHAGGWFGGSEGQIGHRIRIRADGVLICATCHTPSSMTQFEQGPERCGRCHGE